MNGQGADRSDERGRVGTQVTDSGQHSGVKITRLGVKRLTDAVLLLSLWLACLIVFAGAESDFSFDYRHYIRYFDELAGLDLASFSAALGQNLPYPYVSISRNALVIEAGFALVAWISLNIFGSSALAYAFIASTSVVLRTWIARKLGVGWGVLLLLDVYTITLFEANAIRLGCSATLLLYAIYLATRSKHPLLVVMVAAAAALFHLQSLYFTLFFIPLFYGYRLYALRAVGVLWMALILLIVAVVSMKVIGVVGLEKLTEYSGQSAITSGVNLYSMLGCIFIALSLLAGIAMKRRGYESISRKPLQQLWVSLTLACLPSLTVLLLATQMGALGTRLWQLSFVILVTLGFSHQYEAHGVGPPRMVRLVLVGLLLISVVSVVYRYPLSNFFYPLAPYAWVMA